MDDHTLPQAAAAEKRRRRFVHTVGLLRAIVRIALANLARNFCRLIWFERKTAPA
jgi:hypothetical protein